MTRRRRRLRVIALAALGCLVCLPTAWGTLDVPTELPPDSPQIGSAERQALVDFQRDPVANGRALLRLGAGSARQLPLVVLLAAADVHLRAGRLRTATRFFREAARRDAGPPWGTFAELGLGWTALARRDFAAAAKHYRSAAAAGPLGGIPGVMTAWVTALRGRYAEARPLFDRAVSAGDLAPDLRALALLGAAYTRYWMRDFEEAAAAFDRLVSPPTVLSDDARYGAAWSRVRAHDLDTAIPALVALAGAVPAAAPRKRISDAAVSLAPSTVTRSGRESAAQISGFAGPDARVVATFDGDGAALAHAALALLVRRGEVDPHDLPAELPLVAIAPGAPAVDDAMPAAARPVTNARETRPVGPPIAPTATAARGWPWRRVAWIVLGILVLALVVAILRRGDERTNASASMR